MCRACCQSLICIISCNLPHSFHKVQALLPSPLYIWGKLRHGDAKTHYPRPHSNLQVPTQQSASCPHVLAHTHSAPCIHALGASLTTPPVPSLIGDNFHENFPAPASLVKSPPNNLGLHRTLVQSSFVSLCYTFFISPGTVSPLKRQLVFLSSL